MDDINNIEYLEYLKYLKYCESAENKIGISTACFYPMLLESAFDSVCRLKVPVCEIFINTFSETKSSFLKLIKSKADGSNIKIVSVHPFLSGYEEFLFFSAYKRRTLDSIDLYRRFFEAAHFLQSDYVIFHGVSTSKIDFVTCENYAEIFMLIKEEAKKYGVELLQENLGSLNLNNADFIKKIMQADKNIRFTVDFKHTLSGGGDISDIIGVIGANIAHIHLNDMIFPENGEFELSKTAAVNSCRLPFYGNLNYSKILKKLADINYIGNFIIEVYRNNYADENEIAESLRRLKAFLHMA